jgi:hypothetical protein
MLDVVGTTLSVQKISNQEYNLLLHIAYHIPRYYDASVNKFTSRGSLLTHLAIHHYSI